jgi:uncharacterized protein (TIGR03089 family)
MSTPNRHGDKPFLTWYDDRRGERVELSYRTFGNWVAKTANLLVDELGAEPGDRVGVVLVDHWQTPIVLAACWRAGARVVVLDPASPERPTDSLAAAFVREEFLAATAAAFEQTAVIALTADLAGRGSHDLGGTLNYSRVVPTMGDQFEGGPDPGGAALSVGGEEATMAGLLERAAALAARARLGDDDRLWSGRRLLTVDGVVPGLLAPFASGAGVVLARPFDPTRFWKLAADEQVTVAVLDPDQAAAVRAARPPPPGPSPSRLRMVLDD